ncbi:MAG TPA: orotidine-5'-phosphate decarboxylase [Rectinemataceae bacterium]|nr:orotidine-5'-phosphate decarboxylase [Rectinemataceae bacterium]
MNFFARLETVVKSKGSCLCIGLDPRIGAERSDRYQAILDANQRIIEATLPYAAVYKPNIAFYEEYGPEGLRALESTLSLIPDGTPILVDAKRCDIGPTAEAYARGIFGHLGADAVTLSPYMGRDGIEAFLAYEGRGLFVLCRTSNPDAGFLQDLPQQGAEGQEPLFVRVARECPRWSESIGLVVAGNDTAALRAVRAVAPNTWFLAPGIGSQGGDAAEAFEAGARDDGMGILVVAARAVSESADPAGAARSLRDGVERARLKTRPAARPALNRLTSERGRDERRALKDSLMDALLATECFRLGDFLLKSGKRSPFYIDMRRLISDPAALALAAEAYASMAGHLNFDRIAGIPAAALPLATAASLKMGRPLVWPRMPVKEHGTGNRVEGAFTPGDRLLLLDDLITAGTSKLEAAQILRAEGLVVEELVVLIERGKRGRVDMESAGIRLHAFLDVRELFEACRRRGLIDEQGERELRAYVDSE